MAVPIMSAGGIVYRLTAGEPLILMIADSQRRWSFPKGMVNRGEDPAEAARREVEEETGIRGEVLHRLGETRYLYRQSGKLIDKTVYFYLIRARSEAISPQFSEVADARWFPAGEAVQRSAFPANTELLRQAIALLEQEGELAVDLT
ncbi:MAG TPA: NUDIX domain-containing protein [Chloroflexia bacterium]|nr:NUDIX domain-containing protein [Chloroflexia bacterium]